MQYLILVGFEFSEYSASESNRTLAITIGLLSGKLRSEVIMALRFSTPTEGKYAYNNLCIAKYAEDTQ